VADHAEPEPAGSFLPSGCAASGESADGLRWTLDLDMSAVFAALGRDLPRWADADETIPSAEGDEAEPTEGGAGVPAEGGEAVRPTEGGEADADQAEGALAERSASGETAAALPGEGTSEETAPGESTPGEGTPPEAAPGESTPPEAAPGESTPEEAAPGEAAPPGRSFSLAGPIAEALPAGPGLAAWLSGQDPATATNRDLMGMAGAFRRLASWAQAGELAMISQVAARSAAADPRVGLAPDGRPAVVTRDATAQVALELALSPYGAEEWTSLAVTLGWRLPGTARALAEGRIDLYRAKVIAEAVTPLSDSAARAVEDRVLPEAGEMTYRQLHAAVRRAVIAADPEGAERRRESAERRARVSLYPDQDCTATLTGTRLPAAHATAAMARISAMARAMKASGSGGGLELLRAQVFIGLLLGTLPLIPPPADGPPADGPPADGPPAGDVAPSTDPPAGDGPPDADPSSDDRAPAASPLADAGPPSTEPPPAGGPPDTHSPADAGPPSTEPPPGGAADDRPASDRAADEIPPPGDADMPEDDGYRDARMPLSPGYGHGDPDRDDPFDDHFASGAVLRPWPLVPPAVPAGAGPPCQGGVGRPPPGGLLDLTVPFGTLTCETDAPGTLGRFGPVTALQVRDLARLASRHHTTVWRVIVTDENQRSLGVGRVPRPHPPPEADPAAWGPAGSGPAGSGPAGSGPAGLTGVVGRVTVILPTRTLDRVPPARELHRGGIIALIIAAARRVQARARQDAEAGQLAEGGCAHTAASVRYRVPPRIREDVIARDQTCRSPTCGQPAWRGDLDHTIPYHRGGRTCRCNLGGFCRGHHRLKQQAGWTVAQPRPGVFEWTTPAGRTYTVSPDRHPA
jgi:hypothetical protein